MELIVAKSQMILTKNGFESETAIIAFKYLVKARGIKGLK